MTNTINIITALGLWFLTFIIRAFVGIDPALLLLYPIIALVLTLCGNFLKAKVSRVFLIMNFLCLVVPLPEFVAMMTGLFDSSNERFLMKHTLLVMAFSLVAILFIYTSVRLIRSKRQPA
ncbi:MAG TPA: hypothetical protein VGD40_25630 [Chryseosolibacter sp.]